MSDPGYLFTLGNKRSGTTLLVELLNLHPAIFITHESDVIWLLYQAALGRPFQGYPWDGSVGMDATVTPCRKYLEDAREQLPAQKDSIKDLFLRVERHLMYHGSQVQQPEPGKSPLWMGDKKPVQQADPEIFNFILQYFPDARFVHIVRHPQAVVASMLAAGRSWGAVAYWKGSADSVLERWTIHEEWVIAARDEYPDRVYSLRFEDLQMNPVESMTALFRFLDLDMPPAISETIRNHVQPPGQGKYNTFKLPPSDRADAVMLRYDYRR